MRFFVQPFGEGRPKINSYPAVLLRQDNWDDYGYKTLFRVSIKQRSSDSWDEVGDTKIISSNQEQGLTVLPVPSFDRLPSSYCSVGQSFEFYESAVRIFQNGARPFLASLKDLTVQPELRRSFANNEGVETSLFRFDSAERAFTDGQTLISGAMVGTSVSSLKFTTSAGGDTFTLALDFDPTGLLPGRMHAIIGYNGTGKTTILGNLAAVASADSTQRDKTSLIKRCGRFSETQPSFGSVVMVSFSAFDTFSIRGFSDSPKSESQGLNAVYCGLRQIARESGSSSQTFKSMLDIDNELVVALDLARSRHRRRLFNTVVEKLASEPSFEAVGLLDWMDFDATEWRERLATLSTGHKIVLHVAARLVAYLQPSSLVLIDEPESHLHPPLVAALIRALNSALQERESIAVIATHSPVVIQEIPRRFVTVLERAGRSTRTRRPLIETFGENVSPLTQEVFSLDSSESDHRRVLRDLADAYTIEEIVELFGGQMSAQALGFLMAIESSPDSSQGQRK